MATLSEDKIIEIFNKQTTDFINTMKSIFPENVQIKDVSSLIEKGISLNYKVVINNFYEHIYSKYRAQIVSRNEKFFLNLNFTDLIPSVSSSEVNNFKTLWTDKRLTKDIREKCIYSYFDVFVSLCDRYKAYKKTT